MKTVGIGIIGCGARVSGLAKWTLDHSDALQVVGLYDPSSESITSTCALLESSIPAYDSPEELCARPEVDWVMIGSWNCFHREHAVTAFEAGKHVFCEKPLATTLEDCVAMRDAWQKSGKMFSIGFTLRYSPHYRKVRELIADGRIGRIISMEFNETLDFNHGGYIFNDWRRLRAHAGTHLLEKCSHDIDLVNWMVGDKAARVASFGGLDYFREENKGLMDKIGPDAEGRPAFRTWLSRTGNLNPFTTDKDIVDNQVAIVEYENGVRATFHANCAAGIPERRMYICGTEGAIRADVITGTIEYRRIGFGTEIERMDTGSSGGHGGGDTTLTGGLAQSMLEGAEPFTGLEDGLKAAITCYAIDDAMDTGQVVEVAPYWERAGVTG